MNRSTHLLDRITRNHVRGHAEQTNRYLNFDPDHTPKHRHAGDACREPGCEHIPGAYIGGIDTTTCANVQTGLPF